MPDWRAALHVDAGLIEVVLRTAVVYVCLLAGLRVAGKREMGQMTTFDLVLILVISNAVQNAMVGSDNSLTGGLAAAATLLGIDYLVTLVSRRSQLAHRLVEGTPTMLVHEGQFIPEHMRREHLTEDEVMAAMREHGVDEISQVKVAVLEIDGSISIIPQEVKTIRTRRRFRQIRRKA